MQANPRPSIGKIRWVGLTVSVYIANMINRCANLTRPRPFRAKSNRMVIIFPA